MNEWHLIAPAGGRKPRASRPSSPLQGVAKRSALGRWMGETAVCCQSRRPTAPGSSSSPPAGVKMRNAAGRLHRPPMGVKTCSAGGWLSRASSPPSGGQNARSSAMPSGSSSPPAGVKMPRQRPLVPFPRGGRAGGQVIIAPLRGQNPSLPSASTNWTGCRVLIAPQRGSKQTSRSCRDCLAARIFIAPSGGQNARTVSLVSTATGTGGQIIIAPLRGRKARAFPDAPAAASAAAGLTARSSSPPLGVKTPNTSPGGSSSPPAGGQKSATGCPSRAGAEVIALSGITKQERKR